MPRKRAPLQPDLASPELYLNRELAALEFNFRVLAQAQDPAVPLLERLRYLTIVCSNLDEFFEVRVAVLKHQHTLNAHLPGADGLASGEVLARIRQRVLALVDAQYDTWQNDLRPALIAEGIGVRPRGEWTEKQRRWLQGYFQNEIMPVLSPLGLDPSHPFPAS